MKVGYNRVVIFFENSTYTELGVGVMIVVKLLVSCLLLVFGMTVLPPLSGAGAGSILTRVWLVLGLLTFFGHYQYYLNNAEQKKAHSTQSSSMVRRPAARKAARNLEKM